MLVAGLKIITLFSVSEAQVSSAGLSNLWDRYEMLGCQLRHAASSPCAIQSTPVAGKQTADSIRSFSHKQASRNRCRYAGNQSAVVRSDVSVVLTTTDALPQSTVAAPPGVYYLISAVGSLPCVAMLPEDRNPLAPSSGVRAAANPAGLRAASVGVSDGAGDGRESSCFGDDPESPASGDGALSGFLNACVVENDDRTIDGVAASGNGDVRRRIEAGEVVRSKNGRCLFFKLKI